MILFEGLEDMKDGVLMFRKREGEGIGYGLFVLVLVVRGDGRDEVKKT